MNWIANNLAEALVILGLALLALEIWILGFATFVLFFVGLAAVIAGGLMYIELFEATTLNAILSVGVLTALGAALLWNPLKNMQNEVDLTRASSDLVGHSFILAENVSSEVSPNYHYSGVNWKLVSEEPLEAGQKVKVVQTDVGVFHIQAVK